MCILYCLAHLSQNGAITFQSLGDIAHWIEMALIVVFPLGLN